MSSKIETVQYIMEQLAPLPETRSMKMFGEYAIYYKEKMIALICDDRLFIKPTKAGRELWGEPEEDQPYKGAKNWFVVPEENWDDGAWLCQLFTISEPEVALPVKKKKK